MIWLWIPVIIWTIALLVMGLPKFVSRKVQKLQVELKRESRLAKHKNPEESIYKSMEEGLLEIFHFQNLCFISSIIGLLLIALGTVTLCAVLLIG